MAPKVRGRFLEHVKSKEYTAAWDLIDLGTLTPLFSKVGITPNITEAECCAWVQELVFAPLCSGFRLPVSKTNVSEVTNLLRGYSNELQRFKSESKLGHIMGCIESLVVLFDSYAAASAGQSLLAPASTIRKHLDFMQSIPSKQCLLSLAWQHGALAVSIREAVESSIIATSKDASAIKSVAAGVSQLQAFNWAESRSFDGPTATVQELDLALRSMTKVSLGCVSVCARAWFQWVSSGGHLGVVSRDS